MKLPDNFRVLVESENYILGNVFEYGSIIDKRNGKEFYIGDSYGDPDFGLIDKSENWALLFGHDSYFWTLDEICKLTSNKFQHQEIFKLPYDAKQVSDFEVEILDDPWSSNPGIFNLNIKTKTIKRIRDFQKLDIPYESNNKSKISW